MREGHKGKLHISTWKEGVQRLTSGVWELTRSFANKQEELEVCAQSESPDMITITKMKWDSIPDWKSVMEGLQGEQAVKKGSCTYLQDISLSVQRSSVKSKTYLTEIFQSKAKAKATLATQHGGLVYTTCSGAQSG